MKHSMISPCRPKRGESGNSLFIGTLSLVMLIPLMGLTIDASFLYAAKARLQAAVDGASLGAARALNLGNTLQSQQVNAAQNAVNWFYANFPPGTWSTSGTSMSTSGYTNTNAGFASPNVNIFPDTNNPQLDHVNVTASTKVPTYFMKWFGVQSTTLNAVSYATRRAVVVMMVVDRSGSMCAVNGVIPGGQPPCNKSNAGSACAAMISAAKQFTGQFAEGRDYIGMVTFSGNTYVVPNSGGTTGVPDQNFQATLGYTNNFGSGNGYIDNLECEGGTGSPQAIALGYQLLVQAGLPGALNILLFETDGQPNTLTMRFDDPTLPTGSNMTALSNSICKDLSSPTPKTVSGGGFQTAAVLPPWNSFSLNLTSAPFGSTDPGLYPNTPFGMIGTMYSADPGQGTYFVKMLQQWSNPAAQTPQDTADTGKGYYNNNWWENPNGCNYTGGSTNNPDYQWWPTTDVYGNQLNPSNAYKPVTTAMFSGKTRIQQSGANPANWQNFHNGVLNATDNAAYNARANATYPAYIFALGLGNNSAGAPPDPILMQRVANDPNGDTFNSPAKYPACATEVGCVTYGSPQLQGTYVFAPTSNQLAQAFLEISSQILRLNK